MGREKESRIDTDAEREEEKGRRSLDGRWKISTHGSSSVRKKRGEYLRRMERKLHPLFSSTKKKCLLSTPLQEKGGAGGRPSQGKRGREGAKNILLRRKGHIFARRRKKGKRREPTKEKGRICG